MTSTRYDETKMIWYGPDSKSLVDKNTSFGELLLKKLSDGNAERVTQIDGDTGEALTAGDVKVQTIRCAQNLLKFGCTQNDRIVVIARNHHNLTPLTLAAICIGAPVAPLHVSHAKDGLTNFLRKLEPSFVFSDSDVLPAVDGAIREIGIESKIYSINGSKSGFENFDEKFLEPTGCEESFECQKVIDSFKHIAVISCSSGSTGTPKSVILSHAHFIRLLLNEDVLSHYVSLNFSSLYWLSGLIAVIGAAVAGKPRIFTAKQFSPELFFKLVDDYQVEVFVGPPSQFQAIFKSEFCVLSNLKSLKLMLPGGSLLPKTLIESMRNVLPTCQLATCYGMTELGSMASMTKLTELFEKPATVGRLMAGVKMKIVDPNTGENFGPNERGEIRLITTIPFTGYYRNEEATINAIDDDGFFKSGDIGYIDSDGYLFIVGRNGDIFKNCGFFVRPDEIEDILCANPTIKTACVVNVFDEHNVTELPAALVVKQIGAVTTANDICDLVSERLAEYKHLSGGVYFVDALPMTPSGKVMRYKAKVIAQQFFEQLNKNSE